MGRACDLLDQVAGVTSSGEVPYLQIAFHLWNGLGHCDFGRMVAVTHLAAVGGLLLAIVGGPTALDLWLSGREEAMNRYRGHDR